MINMPVCRVEQEPEDKYRMKAEMLSFILLSVTHLASSGPSKGSVILAKATSLGPCYKPSSTTTRSYHHALLNVGLTVQNYLQERSLVNPHFTDEETGRGSSCQIILLVK